MIPNLTTDRLTLGAFEAAHFEPLAAFLTSDRARYVGGPLSREAVWRHLASEIGHWTLRGYGRFAVTETATGALVGNVGLWNPEGWPEPELGWDLMNGFEGRGFAREAAEAVRRWAYRDLGWTTLCSFIYPDNAASIALATRLGAWHERDSALGGHGTVQLWRHPAPTAPEVAA